MMSFLLGFVLGMFCLLGLFVFRMLRNYAWDDSNITNALRLLAHVAVHPDDFGEMYYLDDEEYEFLDNAGFEIQQPFWYINKDELSEVVKTRPNHPGPVNY